MFTQNAMYFMICFVFYVCFSSRRLPPIRRNDVVTQIDRVYYINLDERQNRAEFMEWWLSRQDTLYARISAVQGTTTGCVPCQSTRKHLSKILEI